MAKDYKDTPKPSGKADKKKRKPAGGAPGWLWLLAGLSIGLFVALLVYLKDYSPAEHKRAKPAPVVDKSRPAAPAPKKKTEAAQAQRPRFDFYNLLPEMEVRIPEQELAAEREKKPAEDTVYYLQAGSFRRFEDADRLRARLALLNIETRIQRVTVNDTQTWHRVRVGPFTSPREMDKVRSRLQAESLNPIVLKIKEKAAGAK
jgi:cell division protein FtsN